MNDKISSNRFSKYIVIINFLSAFGFFLTLFFQILLAKEFGASRLTDAYVGASTLPFVIIATMSSLLEKTFIPVFFEYKLKSDIWVAVNNFVTIYFLFLCLVATVVYLCIPILIKIILPGFNGESYFLAVNVLKILLPALIFGGLIGLATAFHYVQDSFILPNIAPSIKWITAIILIVLLKKTYGILSVPIGISAGYFLQFMALLFGIRIIKNIKFIFNLKNAFFLTILGLMWPLLMASFFNNISILIMKGLASKMSEGSISCLDYAYNIVTVVIIVCVQGISIVLFPIFSRIAAENNMLEFKKMFINSQRIILIIILPVMMGLIIFRYPVVKILFERGKFNPESTYKIANLIFGFCGAFLGLAIGTIQSQVYYALKDTKRMMFITFIQMVLFAGLLFIGKAFLSIYFISIAFSAAIFCGCCINYVHINRKLNIDAKDRDITFLLKIFSGAVITGALSYAVFNTSRLFLDNLYFLLGIVLFFATGIYFMLLKVVFIIPETKLLLNLLLPKKYAEQ